MPAPDITPGSPCWADLMTSDLERAKAFYTEIFGWTYQTGDPEKYAGYTTAFRDDQMVAGLMPKMEEQATMPDVWTLYLDSEDIAATADRVTQAGGQVFMPPMDVPEQGRMGVFADAGGAVFGVWEGAQHSGFQLLAEPGSPVWFELHTRAYDDSVAFYQKALGWETDVMSDSEELRYTTLGSGMDSKAGIFDASGDLPEGMPNNWQIYWGVEDTDLAVEKAQALGAALVQGPEDTPFGRLATLTDPTGAVFKVMQDLGRGDTPQP